jgi:hypothetical protein
MDDASQTHEPIAALEVCNLRETEQRKKSTMIHTLSQCTVKLSLSPSNDEALHRLLADECGGGEVLPAVLGFRQEQYLPCPAGAPNILAKIHKTGRLAGMPTTHDPTTIML